MPDRAPSYKKGDRLTLSVTDLTASGEGVAHAGGLACFVKDAVPGDEVQATVTKVKSRLLYAHLDRIITPSPDRITPPCSVAKVCGGCQIQALSYSASLTWKDRLVRQALIRIGSFTEEALQEVMLPIAGAQEAAAGAGKDEPAGIYRYRNKAQLPVAADKDGRPAAGFFAARSHRVIPVTDCLLTDPVFSDITAMVLSHMEERRIPAYNELDGTGVVRHLLIRRGHHSGEIMVCIVLYTGPVGDAESIDADKLMPYVTAGFPGAEELADVLFAGIPGMRSLSFDLNPAAGNVILSPLLVPFRGEPRIVDEMCGLHFALSPLSFYQVNTPQAERLYKQAMAFAALTGKEEVIDLYCGIGTISLLAATRARHVTGVEIIPAATRDAQDNALRNGIDNADFITGKAEEVLPRMAADGSHPDVLIVDPPRAGLDPSCIEAILTLAPSRIVYISCNPSTLARDLKLLTARPEDPSAPLYALTKARAFDLFPQTGHVETVVLLTQRKPDMSIEFIRFIQQKTECE